MTLEKEFTLGEQVRWTSQSGGHSRTKEGEILVVVDKGEYPPYSDIRDKGRIEFGGGTPRLHRSYIIKIPAKGKARPRLYWPRASQLEAIEQAA